MQRHSWRWGKASLEQRQVVCALMSFSMMAPMTGLRSKKTGLNQGLVGPILAQLRDKIGHVSVNLCLHLIYTKLAGVDAFRLRHNRVSDLGKGFYLLGYHHGRLLGWVA